MTTPMGIRVRYRCDRSRFLVTGLVPGAVRIKQIFVPRDMSRTIEEDSIRAAQSWLDTVFGAGASVIDPRGILDPQGTDRYYTWSGAPR